MTKAAISGYYGFGNFGDETILSIILEHLKALNIDVTVFSSNIEYTRKTHNIDAVHSFDIKNLIENIKESDILISGGGSLLQDATSIKSLLYYAFVISLALLFRKKVIIFAQGIGPLNSPLSKYIVRNLFKLCNYISVRDEMSLEQLNKWHIKADLVCDPVFSLNINPVEKQNTIGIQLRDFKTINYDFLQKLALFINAKFSDKNIKIFSLQEAIDMNTALKFQKIINNINPTVKTEIIKEDIVNNLSSLEYFIGMRFHAILTALKAGVKTCAVNYDIKVENLAKEFDIPIIEINSDESLEKIYPKLIDLEPQKLIEPANSKKFDWTKFDTMILQAS